MKIQFAFAVLLLLSLAGCSSEEVVQQLSANERFSLGMAKFKNEDYLEALEDFKIVTLQFQGSAVADDAQYYMAECRYERQEYILAAYEYDVLIRTMPTSEYVSRARFRRATCFYNLSPNSFLDQDYSKKAIDEFQAFLEYHPTDSLASLAEARISELNAKLAKKDYENGITYMNMSYYRAAAYYFDLVIDKYHDTPYAELAHFKKAEALYYRKKYEDAKQTLQKFFVKFPNSELRSNAEKLQENVLEKIADAQSKVAKPSAQKQGGHQSVQDSRN